MNAASRLEGANKQYGTQILIGTETNRLIGDAFLTREIDSIAVYGRTEGLAVYELIGLAAVSGDNTDWIASYEEGLSRYRRRDFSAAIIHFQPCPNAGCPSTASASKPSTTLRIPSVA